MIKEALWVDGWDGMVIIGHRFSKGTFGANSDEENRSRSEIKKQVHFSVKNLDN